MWSQQLHRVLVLFGDGAQNSPDGTSDQQNTLTAICQTIEHDYATVSAEISHQHRLETVSYPCYSRRALISTHKLVLAPNYSFKNTQSNHGDV